MPDNVAKAQTAGDAMITVMHHVAQREARRGSPRRFLVMERVV
jgi:hypothetical protein